jgi:tRNA dimethylallyltransferase
VGYRQIVGYLRGHMDLAGAVEQVKRDTRRFVRQQANWFRDDGRIAWFDVGSQSEDPFPAIFTRVAEFMNGLARPNQETEAMSP